MSSPNFNLQVIDEFRKNHGQVGGYFKGSTLLLLHTVGTRSKKNHVVPVTYLRDGDRYLVFGSKGGADSHPDWYINLMAHPDVEIEVGDEKFKVHATEIKGHDRDVLYARQVKVAPGFGEYEKKTKRVIPVVALTRRN